VLFRSHKLVDGTNPYTIPEELS